MFNDRIKIMNKGAWPETILAPQVLINCGGGGSCEGGSVGGVFDYMEQEGLPDETCQNYEASDTINECKPLGVCETCVPTKDGSKNCSQIKNPQLWTLGDSGYALGGTDLDLEGNLVTGEQKLQAEIMQNGPLACGIHATPALEAFGTTTPVDHYPGGIFTEHALPLPNHILSIVGWGTDKEHGAYWWLRNSWGTYWGENGYGKIKMGLFGNLGVQTSCSYAMPKKMKPKFDTPLEEKAM